jgi:hypothetical protein
MLDLTEERNTPMNEAEFQKEDRDLDRELEHREELEREDIMTLAVNPWRRAMRIVVAIKDEAA